jgi:hypothetical protein
MNRLRGLSVGLAAALAGCTPNYLIVGQENFYTFERPFTDAAAELSRKQAEQGCAYRRMIAIKTSDVCEETKCFTNYQCIPQAEATKYGL